MLASHLTTLKVLWKVLWKVLRTIYHRLPKQPRSAELSVEEIRKAFDALAFFLGAGAPPLPHIEERLIAVPSGRKRVRLYDPGTVAPAPTVILIHGGGWVAGDIDTYDGFARQIAKRSGLRCLSIEYALAPEHPFPAPLDDCIAAVRWAASGQSASLGIDPARIALIGDSAGANLALAVCLALRDAGASPVRGAALAYGRYSLDVVYMVFKAGLAICLWGAAVVGYLRGPMLGWERAVALAAALSLVLAWDVTDPIGFVLAAFVIIVHWRRTGKARVAQA